MRVVSVWFKKGLCIIAEVGKRWNLDSANEFIKRINDLGAGHGLRIFIY